MPEFTIIDMKSDGSVDILIDIDLPEFILSPQNLNQTYLLINSTL